MSSTRSPLPPTPAPTSSGAPTSGAPTSGGGRRTLTGTAYVGAEPSCVGLRAGGDSYELTGEPVRALDRGGGYGQPLGRVRVVGHLAPMTMMSHCMMGRIFVVQTFTRL